MLFATIQFIDRLSESIKDKNLVNIDGKPLWQHNAYMAVESKRFSVSDNSFRIVRNYIVTNYEAAEMGDDFPYNELCFVPRASFNIHKCPLSDRVRDAINYIKAVDCGLDAYIILLGNSRCFVTDIIPRLAGDFVRYSNDFDVTGIMPVTNMSFFGPFRAHTLNHGAFLETTVKRKTDSICKIKMIGATDGEDRHDEEHCSWFYNGGPMVMSSSVRVPGGDWDNWDDCTTQFPYLGNCVVAHKMEFSSCAELDNEWQAPMLTSSYRVLKKTILG